MSDWDPITPGTVWKPDGAAVHNAKLEAAKHFAGRIDNGTPDLPRHPWNNRLDCLNSTGAKLLRGEALAVRTTQYEATSTNSGPWEKPLLVGTAPVWPTDAGRLAISLGTISDTKTGDVAIHGLAFARCEVLSTSHRWVWFSDDSDDPLKTGDAGQAKIVGTTPSVGTDKYILLDLDKEQPLWRFETTAGPTWKLAQLVDGTLTDQEFTLLEPFGLLDRVDESGWKGYVQWVDDKFLPAGAPCEKPEA